MRLLAINSILLACIAASLATELIQEPVRSKRDLQFWKNLIAAKLGIGIDKSPAKNEDIKILRIPGFDNVLVRAVPKISVMQMPAPQKIVQVDPNLSIIQSYLGTQTPDQTIVALEGVKNLLQSGVLATREVVEMAPPQQSVFFLPPPIQQRVVWPEPTPVMFPSAPRYSMYPIYPEPQPVPVWPQPVPAMKSMVPFRPVPLPPPMPAPLPPVVPVIPAPPPMPALRPFMPVMPPPPLPVVPEIVVPEIKPLPAIVPLPVVPTIYDYKQVKKDGSVTNYFSRGSHDVIVTETNVPLPPPPSYIIDRFQKIVYGLPLGVSEVPVTPGLPPMVTVIATKPTIDIKGTNSEKKLHQGSINLFEGTLSKKHSTSTLVQEQIGESEPLPVAVADPIPVAVALPTAIVDEVKPVKGFSYKHFYGDGTMTAYTGSEAMKEPFVSVTTGGINKIPVPPKYIMERIEKVADQAHSPKSMWGYSFRIANGFGTYENTNKDKIYYSRLEPGAPKAGLSVIPDPLSSNTDSDQRRPNKNTYVINESSGSEKTAIDEYGNPFLSTKINEEKSSDISGASNTKGGQSPSTQSTGSNIEPVKLIPKLPEPIVGENEQTKKADAVDLLENVDTSDNADSVKLVGNADTDKTKEGGTKGSHIRIEEEKETGYKYTQIHHDGSITKISDENGKANGVLVAESIQEVPMLPSAVIDVIEPPTKVPVAIEVKQKYPSAVVDVVQSISKVPVPVRHPSKVFDVIHPVPKIPAVVDVKQRYPSAIIDVVHPIHKVKHPSAIVDIVQRIPEMHVPVKKYPSAIVDVIQPVHSGPVAVKVAKKHPTGAVMFAEHVPSTYTYKQISHTNPQPFTVVRVEDTPRVKVVPFQKDVRVKVNRHEHTRPDGTKYPCTDVHVNPDFPAAIMPAPGIPLAPAPAMPNVHVEPTVPNGFIYVPPLTADAPSPSKNNEKPSSHFSYTQISSTTTLAPETTTEEHLSLSLNPIVVESEDTKYSYTQKHHDGTSMTVEGNKDNTVSVNIDDVPKSLNSSRGDIPDALA